jgi:hypothetical protein
MTAPAPVYAEPPDGPGRAVGSDPAAGRRAGPDNDGAVAAVSHRTLLVLAAAGGAVSVALGVYADRHVPTGGTIVDLGFPSLRAMKSWLATASFALVIVQVISAMAMYGRLPFLSSEPRWVAFAHRWSGTTAFVVSLPVAYHCLWALGFQTASARPLLHGLFGCAFYGAITTKLLALRSDRLPRWSIPVLGSLVALSLTGIWLTSALWFFTNVSFPALPQ